MLKNGRMMKKYMSCRYFSHGKTNLEIKELSQQR